MKRHDYIDPTIAALLNALAPDNLRLPHVTPPRDPLSDDDATEPAQASAPRNDDGN